MAIDLRHRLLAKAHKTEFCWEWTGRLDRDGYGKMSVGNVDTSTHRISYELEYGPIPAGLCVCHRCDNRKCVRPDHLFLGTIIDNTADRDRKDRQARGRHIAAAKLTELQITRIRELLESGDRQVDIASKYGISQSNVSAIKLRQRWRQVA